MYRSNRATTSNTACTHEALSAHVNKWKWFRGRMRWCCPARRTTQVNSIACNCCGLQLLLCSPSLHPAAPSHSPATLPAHTSALNNPKYAPTGTCASSHRGSPTAKKKTTRRCYTDDIAKHTICTTRRMSHTNSHWRLQLCVQRRRSAAGTQSKAVTANRQPPELACCRCHRGRLRWAAQAKPQALRAIDRSVWAQMMMGRWGQARRRLCE